MSWWLFVIAVGVGFGLSRLWDAARWETVTVTTRPAGEVIQPETVFAVRIMRDTRRWVVRVLLAGMRENGYSGAVQWIEVDESGKTLTGRNVHGRKEW